VTIHSFAGVGFGNEPLPDMIAKVERSTHAKKRWKQCRTLILDEISMMDGMFFEKLAAVGARVRHDPRPFGGIQLVLCGDFLQLPPVGIGQSSGVCFCFEAPCWPTALPNCVVLSSAFR
jgi:ATP-dependent DNA helicase PIF1